MKALKTVFYALMLVSCAHAAAATVQIVYAVDPLLSVSAAIMLLAGWLNLATGVPGSRKEDAQ